MAFQICLVYDPETHLIREIIQPWVIQLMRCADSIDVVTLHSKQVFFHELVRHGTTTGGMVLMAVDSAEDDSFTINQEQAIFHLNLPETDSLGNNLNASGDHQVVEVWRLGSPFQGVLDLDAELGFAAVINLSFYRSNFLLLGV